MPPVSVSAFSLGGIVSALGIGVLIDRFGAIRTLVSALVISRSCCMSQDKPSNRLFPALLMGLLAASGFFVLGTYGGVNVVLATFYPASHSATGNRLGEDGGAPGTLLAPIMIGTALTAGIRETTVMSLFAVPAILAAVSLLVIGFSSRKDAGLATGLP